MIVKVKKLHPEAVVPQYQTKGAAGFDLHAFLKEYPMGIIIPPKQRLLVGTALVMEVPEGFELQIRPRSGLAFKQGVTVLNSPGTVDSDYRGEIKVLLINNGTEDVHIEHNDRIAQGVIKPVPQAEFEEVEDLSVTKRGEGGFGSSGK